MGVENGTFLGWQPYIANVTIPPTGGIRLLGLADSEPIAGRHTIIENASPQLLDYYGNFPINSPNGSKYSIQLGDIEPKAQLNRIVYAFTIPTNQTDFNLTYNYAVVLEQGNPKAHSRGDWPSFNVRVFDATAEEYVQCYTLELSWESNGFMLSPFGGSTLLSEVYYKPWSSVSLNFADRAGHSMYLEFTVNDCSVAEFGHFGYAYVDVVESCQPAVTGNTFCLNNPSITLRAPEGYKDYYWYKVDDMDTILGRDPRLLLSPPPPDGTRYAVRVIPYPRYGCEELIFTTVKSVSETVSLNVMPSVTVCSHPGLNLKDAYITQGSSEGLTFSYYTDAAATKYIPNAEKVIQSGTYYIKATNGSGCEEIRSIDVTVIPAPTLVVNEVSPVCLPQTINLTAPEVTSGSVGIKQLSYWRDEAATVPLLNPQSVAETGTYYIKAIGMLDCAIIEPVEVAVEPVLMANAPDVLECAPVDLTVTKRVNTNATGTVLTYWMDAAATEAIPDPTRIMDAGTYYIKVANFIGCSMIIPIHVALYNYPMVEAKDPIPQVYPAKVDLGGLFPIKPNHTYTYWLDSKGTKSLSDPVVNTTGIYYIKITNSDGCSSLQRIRVDILPSPLADVTAATAFSPNGDGMNDVFKVKLTGAVQIKQFKIVNRWGLPIYVTNNVATGDWDGTSNGNALSAGTYYWIYQGVDLFRNEPFTRSGPVTIIR